MANCEWCNQNMLEADGCTANFILDYPDGVSLDTIPYFNEYAAREVEDVLDTRCHDCGVKWNKRHHPGCDMEICPRCCGQLLSCGCLMEDEEEDLEGDEQFLEDE